MTQNNETNIRGKEEKKMATDRSDELYRALKERSCTAVDWDEIEVVENFKTDYIYHTRFSGKVRLGVFEDCLLYTSRCV